MQLKARYYSNTNDIIEYRLISHPVLGQVSFK